MSRTRWAAAVALLLLAGCGVRPSGVTDSGAAPTGIAPGSTLYFIDAHGELRPQQRASGRLGTVGEAVTLLLYGPGGSGMRTGITSDGVTRVETTITDTTIELRMPVTSEDVTPLGVDQIVCTALAVHVQGGGSARTTVRLYFTQPAPGSEEPRTCPLINPGR